MNEDHADETRPQLAPEELGAALAKLRSALTEGASLETFAAIAGPRDLEFLMSVELASLVRTGPSHSSTSSAPSVLIERAQRAAERGYIGLSAAADLRQRLDRLSREIFDSGMWDREQTLWWDPLPPALSASVVLSRLAQAERLASSTSKALRKNGGWAQIRHLVPSDLVAEIHQDLESAYEAGALPARRGTVGESARESPRRTDSAFFVSGVEAWLLETSPTLATVVQWLLGSFVDGLVRHLDPQCFSPRRAMVSRYPAPSCGFDSHFDNPGGERDNHRFVTLVLYLNAPQRECRGGALVLGTEGLRIAARSGSAAIFDSCEILHQVLPIEPGPARWALTVWLSDRRRTDVPWPKTPELEARHALAAIVDPILPSGVILTHELDDADPVGHFHLWSPSSSLNKAAIVSTVYRGGTRLEAWCRHHFALGFVHLILVFDHFDEPEEEALARRIQHCFGVDRVTIWSGAKLAREGWQGLSGDSLSPRLLRIADGGTSSSAVSARQTLNASLALQAAAAGDLPETIDWLLHLDADELFHIDGAARGGACLDDHFSAAAAAGVAQIRYVNHELLDSDPNGDGARARFKLNPRLLAARLGPAGLRSILQQIEARSFAERPYFLGYHNGKSAVRVEYAQGAAGMHAWKLRSQGRTMFVAGPSILHFHLPRAIDFKRKYLAIAASTPRELDDILFEPSPTELKVVAEIESLREQGRDSAFIGSKLDEMYQRLTSFDEQELGLLEDAGMVSAPEIEDSVLAIFSRQGRSANTVESSDC